MQARTWGPFTGRQLTTIVCVVVVTVLFPITSWAAGSTLFIGDPHNSNHAAVDAAGNLKAKISSGTVTISGVAPGNIAQTDKFLQGENFQLTVGNTNVLAPPTGRELIVTSVQLAWYNADPAQSSFALMKVGSNANCSGNSSYSRYFHLPNARDFRAVEFTPGFIVPAGMALCVVQGGAAGPTILFSAFGYSVPAGSVSLPGL